SRIDCKTDRSKAPMIVIRNIKMVTLKGMVLYTQGDTEGFFRLPQGRPVLDISKMAVSELIAPVTTGIQKVFRTGEKIAYTNILISGEVDKQLVALHIFPMPARTEQEPLAAVVIRKISEVNQSATPTNTSIYNVDEQTQQRIKDLELELQFSRENLQATIEELETSNEELQATNEELLASNEELQSTNEELQSTNEELYTVNNEYQDKITELIEANNDIDNLLTNSRIGQLLLDQDLMIRHFSPEVANIFRILNSDLGRPITHLVHLLQDTDPAAMVHQVLHEEQPLEKVVRTKDGASYLMRCVPYVIGPNAYSGVMMTFVDVSEIRDVRHELSQVQEQAYEALSIQEDKYQRLFQTMDQGVVYQDASGKITSANPSALRILGLTMSQLTGRTSMDDRWRAVDENNEILPGDRHPSMLALKTGKAISDFTMGVFNPQFEEVRWILVSATPIFSEGKLDPIEVYTTFTDITEIRRATENKK
ncbi:MAG: PAS domain-containing protein, partial [Deltaproteobacteria bacterium]|nr:PAS domain-containing protein [Deltaproteobacteria bacterium]